MTDKLRKYVLPNIPYVFIGWVFLKLGTAYRLAAGSDFAHKLLGLGQTIGAAFADFAPGLALFDWLVGIVGAVAFRLLIYFKSKNAKKFRRDAEYGSARWGNEKDIKPFVDPKFENNMLLTATERLTMNTRPKNPANARNLNFCGIGSSGSGKTRFWLTPQLLQAHSSYVVVDPKGGVLGQVGSFLQKRGYKIKVFNSIDFSKSMHYNPLAYIKTEADILKFVNALISNTKGEGKEGDPFWTKAETLLYCALKDHLEKYNYQVFFTLTGANAIERIKELSPDLIILDLMLPFISGDELIRNIRKFSDVPVIVVSAKSLTFNKVELLRLGADDYLTKPFDLDELLARIERNLLRSQKDTPNLCLTFGELSINTSSKIVTVADEIIVLTAKEYQLVELLAKYPDKVFSKQNLYESIWQEPFARDNDVINTHISNLRKKLKGEGCRIKTIWGLGYRFAK